MRSGTISVVAVQSMQIWHATFSPIATRWEISRGSNFLGTKFLGAQISQGPNKSGAQMRSGTISVTAVQSMQIWHATFSPIATRWEISRQDLMQLSYV